jgi:uncharacterized membrane protein
MAASFDILSWAGDELFDWAEAPRNLFVSATYALIFGAVFSLPTALTGFWDWLKSTPKHTQAWRTANWHMAVMLTLTLLVIINIVMRLGDFDTTGATGLGMMIFTAIIGLVVSFGSAYGGSLVYDYGFNVEQGNDHVWETSEVDKMPGQGLTE